MSPPQPGLRLEAGDLPPEIVTPPPGPRARALGRRLAAVEAPGINTVYRGEPGIPWLEALGVNVLDVDGNRYLDLTSGFGVAAVGHRHPRVVAALEDQGRRLLHGLGDVAAHPGRIELAERLAGLAPMADPRVYFAVSGSDAVEIAVKTAILATGRAGIVAFDPAYHGLTLGALAATSRKAFREPFAGHLHPHLRRLPWAAAPDLLAETLDQVRPACVLVEPIVGREGVLLPPAGWLTTLAGLCEEREVVLIADEVFTGFGRTGRRFAVDGEGVRPDILCCGKALGGGLPIGAVLLRGDLAAAWTSEGEALHTATFVGHPLATAAALAVLEILEEGAGDEAGAPQDASLAARAERLGEGLLAPRLAAWPERFPAVTATRGRGLLWGVELVAGETAGKLVHRARSRGLLALAGGPEGKVLQVVPPLTIPEGLLGLALDLLEACLEGL